MVSTLDSHPADRGSIPHIYLNFFLFFLVILLRKYSLIIQKVQNSTQKLFVQFHYFKLFMYVYITYNEKKESNVLGHLLLITIIFWTVWSDQVKPFSISTGDTKVKLSLAHAILSSLLAAPSRGRSAFQLVRGKSLLELWVTTFVPDWQPPLIYVRFISNFLCMCSNSMASVHVILK